MGDSLQKAFLGVIAVSLLVGAHSLSKISDYLAPISRDAELDFLCNEWIFSSGPSDAKKKRKKRLLTQINKLRGFSKKELKESIKDPWICTLKYQRKSS